MVKLLYILLLLLSTIMMSCVVSKELTPISTKGKQDLDGSKYFFNYDSLELKRLVLLFPDFSKLSSINIQDTVAIDSILKVVIKKNNNIESEISTRRLENVEKYYKQVVPFLTNKGDLNLWINCSCSYKSYWKKKIIQIDDGGSCFFNFFISLEKKKYYDLTINQSL